MIESLEKLEECLGKTPAATAPDVLDHMDDARCAGWLRLRLHSYRSRAAEVSVTIAGGERGFAHAVRTYSCSQERQSAGAGSRLDLVGLAHGERKICRVRQDAQAGHAAERCSAGRAREPCVARAALWRLCTTAHGLDPTTILTTHIKLNKTAGLGVSIVLELVSKELMSWAPSSTTRISSIEARIARRIATRSAALQLLAAEVFGTT